MKKSTSELIKLYKMYRLRIFAVPIFVVMSLIFIINDIIKYQNFELWHKLFLLILAVLMIIFFIVLIYYSCRIKELKKEETIEEEKKKELEKEVSLKDERIRELEKTLEEAKKDS